MKQRPLFKSLALAASLTVGLISFPDLALASPSSNEPLPFLEELIFFEDLERSKPPADFPVLPESLPENLPSDPAVSPRLTYGSEHKINTADSEPEPLKAGDPLDFASYQEDKLTPGSYADEFKQGNGSWRIGAPVPGGKGSGVIPPQLKNYYTQKAQLSKEKCQFFYGFLPSEGGAPEPVCGYVIVPIDYAHPEKGNAAISVFKTPSINQPSKGSLFINYGGPGVSGKFAPFDHEKLRQDYDIVGFDPRGVGLSLPQILCESTDAFIKQSQSGDGISFADASKVSAYNAQKCLENTGKYYGISGKDFLPTLGTINVVKDLDILRSVLGNEKLNYLGYSYGTRIGYTYAQTFPKNVGAFVLDGAENPLQNNDKLFKQDFTAYYPESTSVSRSIQQAAGFNNTFKHFLRKCLKGEIERKLFPGQSVKADCFAKQEAGQITGEPTDYQINIAYQKFQDLIRKAWKTGYYHSGFKYGAYEEGNYPISFNTMYRGAAIQPLYNENSWYELNEGLIKLATTKNASLINKFWLSYHDISLWSVIYPNDHRSYRFNVITTMDSGQDEDAKLSDTALEKDQKESEEEYYRVAPFWDPGKNPDGSQRYRWLGRGRSYYLPASTSILPQGNYLKDLPNILVISSTNDSATPYPNGIVLAKLLKGTLLTVANNSHCAYGKIDCASAVTERYFKDPSQFNADLKSGKLNSSNYTGPSNVETKDLYSKIIKGNTCQLTSFQETNPGKPGGSTSNPGTSDTGTSDSSKPGTSTPNPGNPNTGKLSFIDIAGYPFVKEIEWLASSGVTTGYPDRTFRPHDSVSRAAMAAFLYRLEGKPDYKAPAKSPFTDIKPGDDFYKEICWLASKGITTGYADKSFKPWDSISREAMAAFLHRYDSKVAAKKLPVKLAAKNFTDTAATPFAKDIAWLSSTGVTTGYADGSFKPYDPIERGAIAAFFYRMKH